MNSNLILLHGALGSKEQLNSLKQILENNLNVYTLNLEGHGGEFSSNEFSTKLFAKNLCEFIEKNNLERCNVFGYSMGGYVALEVALTNSGYIDKIITLGTKFKWDKESAEREVKMMNPDIIEKKIPHFAQSLKERHDPQDWKVIMSKTAALMSEMPNGKALTKSDFKNIPNEILILIGDEDKMVTIEESEQTSRQLPNAKHYILENTPHPIEMVDVKMLANIILDFLK
jgi:pimeloyl-ACP methyl ester carboxylesterase